MLFAKRDPLWLSEVCVRFNNAARDLGAGVACHWEHGSLRLLYTCERPEHEVLLVEFLQDVYAWYGSSPETLKMWPPGRT